MRFYWFVLGTLCVWRITHMLTAEDGPWSLMIRLRQRAGTGWWGSLLDCFFCLSLWTAAPFALFIGDRWKERLLLWPALSAGAILLERIAKCGQVAPPAPYFEDKGDEDVLLRKAERTVLRNSSDPQSL